MTDSIVNAMVVESLVHALVPTSEHEQQRLLEQCAREMLSEFARLDDACANLIYESLMASDEIASAHGKRINTARQLRRWWETMNGRRL